MSTIAKPAIMWTCENCGRVNYGEDTLEPARTINRGGVFEYVDYEDHILCQYCGADNHVIKEE